MSKITIFAGLAAIGFLGLLSYWQNANNESTIQMQQIIAFDNANARLVSSRMNQRAIPFESSNPERFRPNRTDIIIRTAGAGEIRAHCAGADAVCKYIHDHPETSRLTGKAIRLGVDPDWWLLNIRVGNFDISNEVTQLKLLRSKSRTKKILTYSLITTSVFGILILIYSYQKGRN